MSKPKASKALFAAPAPESTPDAITSLPAAPAPVKPEETPDYWRDAVTKATARLDTVRDRDAELRAQDGPIELSIILGHGGAQEQAEAHRAERREMGVALESAAAAVGEAESRLAAAETAEAARLLDMRIAAAKRLARRHLRASAQLDAALQQLNVIAAEMLNVRNALSGFRDLPVAVPTAVRMRATEFLTRGIWHNAPAFARLLDIGAVSPTTKVPLVEMDRSAFSALLAVETTADSGEHDADVALPVTATAVAEEVDPMLGKYGAVCIDTLNTGGKSYAPGTRLPADVVLTWPLLNRLALMRAGRVEFLKQSEPELTRATLPTYSPDLNRRNSP